MKFDTVVIMGKEFEIKMCGEVSHLPLGPPKTLSLISRQSVRHTKIAVTKRLDTYGMYHVYGGTEDWSVKSSTSILIFNRDFQVTI